LAADAVFVQREMGKGLAKDVGQPKLDGVFRRVGELFGPLFERNEGVRGELMLRLLEMSADPGGLHGMLAGWCGV